MFAHHKLQNIRHVQGKNRVKCNFDARGLAFSNFCKFVLHIMQAFLAFCANFSGENALFEIIIAFYADINYIVNRGKQSLDVMGNEVFFMLAVIGACSAAYFAGMILMTVKGMKE